jgi:2'-5' RNA ligase
VEGHSRRPGRAIGRPPQREGTARLFFALCPDDATRATLGTLARLLCEQCGGRTVPAANIHLTLVFLGAVRIELVPALARMARATPGEPVALVLDTVEYWRHNRIVWAGATLCPAPLRDLASRLAEGASRLGLPIEAREYVPHITLLRKAERAPAQKGFDTIAWRASEFALMRSVKRPGGVAYEAIGSWPLARGADGGSRRSQPAA